MASFFPEYSSQKLFKFHNSFKLQSKMLGDFFSDAVYFILSKCIYRKDISPPWHKAHLAALLSNYNAVQI